MMDQLKPLYDKAVAEAKAKGTPEKRRGVGLAWGGYNVGLGSDDFANQPAQGLISQTGKPAFWQRRTLPTPCARTTAHTAPMTK